jgi:hypothetical protein
VLRTINGEAVKVPGDVVRLTAPGPRRWGIEVQRGGQQLLLRFRI